MSSRSYGMLMVNVDDGVQTIVLNNPVRRNAIGPQMVNELLYALEDARENNEVRSIVLTGEGKAFCAGGDFSQMSSGSDGDATLPPKGDYADLLLCMARFNKPLIARVNGHAMGGGLGLLASCHFAIGASNAKIGTPEINVGLFPMMIMAVLARIMPRRTLIKMMLYGERLTAEEAVNCGLLNEAVAPDDLDDAVKQITNTVGSKSPIAVKLGLEALAAQDDLDLENALPLLRERLMACLGTDDAREGLMAFMEKREANWTGR